MQTLFAICMFFSLIFGGLSLATMSHHPADVKYFRIFMPLFAGCAVAATLVMMIHVIIFINSH